MPIFQFKLDLFNLSQQIPFDAALRIPETHSGLVHFVCPTVHSTDNHARCAPPLAMWSWSLCHAKSRLTCIDKRSNSCSRARPGSASRCQLDCTLPRSSCQWSTVLYCGTYLLENIHSCTQSSCGIWQQMVGSAKQMVSRLPLLLFSLLPRSRGTYSDADTYTAGHRLTMGHPQQRTQHRTGEDGSPFQKERGTAAQPKEEEEGTTNRRRKQAPPPNRERALLYIIFLCIALLFVIFDLI